MRGAIHLLPLTSARVVTNSQFVRVIGLISVTARSCSVGCVIRMVILEYFHFSLLSRCHCRRGYFIIAIATYVCFHSVQITVLEKCVYK